MEQLSETDLSYLELTAKHMPSQLGTEENAKKILSLLAELAAMMSLQEEKEKLESEFDDLGETVEELCAEIEDKETEIADLEDKVCDLEGEITDLRSELDVLS